MSIHFQKFIVAIKIGNNLGRSIAKTRKLFRKEKQPVNVHNMDICKHQFIKQGIQLTIQTIS